MKQAWAIKGEPTSRISRMHVALRERMDAYVSYFLGDTEEKVEGEGAAGSEAEAGEGEEGEEAREVVPPKREVVHEFDLSGIKQRIAEKRAMNEGRERRERDSHELPDDNGFGMRYARGPDGTRGFAAGRGRRLATPAPAADAAAGEERAARAAAALATFGAAAQFEGARAGQVFQLGPQGVGYYLDPLAPARTQEAAPPSASAAADATAGGSTQQGGEAANGDEGFNAFLFWRRPTPASSEPASSEPASSEPASSEPASSELAAAPPVEEAAAAAPVAAAAALVPASTPAPTPAPALEPAAALKPSACPPSSLELVGVLPSSVLAVLRSHIAECGADSPLSARAVAAELERRMGMPAGTLAAQHTSIAAATDRASLALAGSVSSDC